MPNAYYSSTIGEFRAAETKMVLGELARHHQFVLNQRQRDAWLGQIELLKDQLSGHEGGHILFEFTIPRLGKRVDVVLIIEGVVFILEFKVGESTHIRAALEQAHDYALDLKNFHEDSHRLPLVPLVVTPAAEDEAGLPSLKWAHDRVAEPQVVSGADLSAQLELMVSQVEFGEIDVQGWIASRYKPTPTIVEAAEALYRNHRVDEITRSDAGRQNLNVTNDAISAIIEAAKRDGSKAICFVTGVPGAGKTLAGLNVATGRAQHHEDEHAVFLSGNGPLVAVLREALARDEAQRKEEERQEEEAAPRERMTIARARSKVESFVQNIHHFRDDALRSQAAPIEQVVVFDEAQRAWTRKQASKFMQTKRGVSDFDMSEPEFLISVMDRHDDWCVVICLVGGGQEINSGEAGIGEWLRALHKQFGHWQIHLSERFRTMHGGFEDAEGIEELEFEEVESLHLAVSIRSFRAEALSDFVGHVVENQPEQAQEAFGQISEHYPLQLTRDLEVAKRWLRGHARGSERFGVLASSRALRLRPEGIQVKVKVDAPNWFLNDRSDVRSSYYCEEVATEFDIQGLELDWTCVCWDGDFRYDGERWHHLKFRGTKWQRDNQVINQRYLTNAYRVLLTRARQGMIIFVPRGDPDDPTRPPAFYDHTYAYLLRCGVPELES